MKVLVLGASGLVGRELIAYFEKYNVEYLGTYYKNSHILNFTDNIVFLDVYDQKSLLTIIDNYNPNICINCIVQRNIDACNQWENIKYINIDIVEILAKHCLYKNIILIHLSTEYIFDGLKHEYYPDDIPDPLQNYGISKLISEFKIINNSDKYIIIRLPTLYTDKIINLNESSITIIGKKVLNRIETFKENNYHIRRPLFINDLCDFIYDIIIAIPNSYSKFKLNEIYHFYNQYDKATKYQIAIMIANYLNKNTDNIISDSTNDITRPYDVNLLDDKYNISDYHITKLSDGLHSCFEKLYHPKIFNNSFKSDFFLLLDLDGTLIDTDKLHIRCYNEALASLNIQSKISDEYLDYGLIDDFLKINIKNQNLINLIKNNKHEYFKQYFNEIKLLNGVYKFIDYIYNNNINHCIVTNSSYETIVFLKDKIPILNKLTNWICRNDYINPKPNSECYDKAKSLYYKNEKYIIGFENTIYGYKALKNITDIIYIICNLNTHTYNNMKNEDVYLINNFYDL